MSKFIQRIKVFFLLIFKNIYSFNTRRVDQKTFIVIASLVVGILSSLAAVGLKSVVHFFQYESKKFLTLAGTPFLIYIFPLIGIIISILIINLLFKGRLTRGLSNVIYSIIRKRSDLPGRKIFSHLLTSGATVGMGGSVGLEAPIVVIGAALGSNFAKGFKLSYHNRTLLLACGSAAGISAIFNSPIAGVIFAFEILLPDMTVSSFIPLLISSASSAVLSRLIYTGDLFYLATEGWHFYALPYYIILGVLCGFISVYMIRITLAIENKAALINNQIKKIFIGGLLLCLLIFLLPPLFGEGYSTIVALLSGKSEALLSGSIVLKGLDPQLLLIIAAILIVFTKVIATSLTIGSGGNGGIIAPSLFTGGITGFVLAHTLKFFGIVDLNHPNFIVVGMAGILAGVLHAPLTSIFLIAEITGGYILIVPLMIVSALSYFISKYFNQYSVYTAALAHKGIDIRSEKENFSIQNLTLRSLVETDFHIFRPNMRLRDLVEQIQHSRRNLFPVVNDEGKLVGVVTLDDVRGIMLDKDIYDMVLIYEVMNSNFHSIDIDTDINTAIKIFQEQLVWNIAVTKNGKYAGFISKSNLFNQYITLWNERRLEEI